jgi:sec-independent protein translocase protein TatC
MAEKQGFEMTFLEHLGELRGRLIICVSWFALVTAIGGVFGFQPVLDLLQNPMRNVASSNDELVLTLLIAHDGSISVKEPPLTVENYRKLHRTRFKFQFNGLEPTTATLEQAAGDHELTTDTVEQSSEEQEYFLEVGKDYQSQLFYFSLFSPFLMVIKVALLIGVFLSLPMWVWQLWLFMSPGLKGKERRLIRPIIWSSVLLFPAGAGFAYCVLLLAVKMITGYYKYFDWLEPRLDVIKYMNFVVTFMLIFGILFQTPLVIVLLVRLRLLTTKFLRKNRKFAILIIMIMSAILTPADPLTMLAMGVPLLLLFEISIWVSVLLEPKDEET